jgi:hypothetical protein
MNGTSIALRSLWRLEAFVLTVFIEYSSDSVAIPGEVFPEEVPTEGLVGRTVDSEIQSNVKTEARRLSDQSLVEEIIGRGAVLGRGLLNMASAAGSCMVTSLTSEALSTKSPVDTPATLALGGVQR